MEKFQGNYSEDAITQPTVFDQLIKQVELTVKEQHEKRAIHQNEKFLFPHFFRLLIFYFISGFKSISLLINALEKDILAPELMLYKVARSTFNDAFERFSSDMFKAVFISLLSSLSLKAIPELQSLGVLYCIDGSLFPTLSSMLWADYKKNSRAIRLHLCFELNRMIPVDIIVGSGNSSERKALLQMLNSGVTYIADRGYASFTLFNKILEAQAHLIVRVKDNLVISNTIESLNVNLPQSVQLLFQDVSDRLIQYKGDPHGNIYRLVCFRVGKELYHILTDRQELSTFQIIVLYAYRWQIELFFRFFKRTMTGIHLINNSQNGVTIQFYSMLISALLQLKLKQDIALQEQDDEQISDNSSEIENQKTVINPYQFFAMIGNNMKKFWKMGIHWLSTLQQILHKPFNANAIEILSDG